MSNNLSVLICDDSMLIRKKLRDELEKLQCKEVYESENGDIAVQLVKEKDPDLILMDIVMPEKDGIEALEEIMEIKPDAKVVMASSVGTKNHVRKALEKGAYDFIQKPITSESITHLIEKVREEDEANV